MINGANTISQSLSPASMRSRLLALVAVAFLGSTPIGGPITGWIGDHVGAEWSLAYGSAFALICATLGFIYLRHIGSSSTNSKLSESLDAVVVSA